MPGPETQRFPNASKSWLVTKETFLSEAKAAFAGTRVNITNHGRPYLGAAIGTNDFVSTYVKTKVKEWISYIDQLGLIAKTQPHAAFSALTHGLSSKWTYLSRTIPDIYDLLLPLDNAIRSKLIPELTGRPPPNDLEFNLFSIPARLGGLGINIPSKTADKEFTSSLQVTSPICQNILLQCNSYSVPHEERELILGMYDVTSIATIHYSKQNGRQKPALLQSEVALDAVYASRDAR